MHSLPCPRDLHSFFISFFVAVLEVHMTLYGRQVSDFAMKIVLASIDFHFGRQRFLNSPRLPLHCCPSILVPGFLFTPLFACFVYAFLCDLRSLEKWPTVMHPCFLKNDPWRPSSASRRTASILPLRRLRSKRLKTLPSNHGPGPRGRRTVFHRTTHRQTITKIPSFRPKVASLRLPATHNPLSH